MSYTIPTNDTTPKKPDISNTQQVQISTENKIIQEEGSNFGEIVIYFVIRLVVILLGLYLAYKFVMMFIKPNILEKMCLTDTNNCSSLEIYRWENTFIAKELISQIWFWYNGSNLYVWGQTSGSCDQGYIPAAMYSLSLDNNKNFNVSSSFSTPTNVCIDSPEKIVEIYKIEKKSNKEMIYLYRDDPNKLNTMFTIIKSMYDNKIFSL